MCTMLSVLVCGMDVCEQHSTRIAARYCCPATVCAAATLFYSTVCAVWAVCSAGSRTLQSRVMQTPLSPSSIGNLWTSAGFESTLSMPPNPLGLDVASRRSFDISSRASMDLTVGPSMPNMTTPSPMGPTADLARLLSAAIDGEVAAAAAATSSAAQLMSGMGAHSLAPMTPHALSLPMPGGLFGCPGSTLEQSTTSSTSSESSADTFTSAGRLMAAALAQQRSAGVSLPMASMTS